MPRSYIYVFLTAETPDGKPIEMYEVFGKGATFDRNFSSPADLYERIDRLYRRLKEKCEGVYAVAGEKTVILGGHSLRNAGSRGCRSYS